DLYLLEASAYHDGAACLGSSRRTPTSAGTLGGGGYAPDWVPLVVADTNYFPAAIVAVYGVNSSPGTKHFRVESFRTVALTVGAGAIYDEVVQYASDWWTFVAVNGQDYTVRMTQTSGDSDLFVYENTSSEFVSKNTGTGDADIFFTAAETGEHFIRVYGWSGGTSGYEIRVTSP
ncbi:MAG: hypothetical protein FJX74_11260, partial [Armatimonadetes bacterium]|nr:hypothetical protein [Armatimonadota bacterium]